MSPAERSRLIMERIQSVIDGSELIRLECNRIRNEFLTLGIPIDSDFLALVSHLQIDIVHLRVKVAYMKGAKGEEMQRILSHLENPMSQLSNEDPA